MSESLGRSTMRYRAFVRKRADVAAQHWSTALQSELPSDLTTYDAQVQYWNTLTVMSLINWAGADKGIEDAQRAAMRRYQEELDLAQELPPSAAYLLDHPNGDFLTHTIQAPEAEPLALIQHHIELIQDKEAVLRAVNSLFAVIQEGEAGGTEGDKPLGLVGKLTKQRKALIGLKTIVQGMNRRLAAAKRKPVSDASSWNIVTTAQVPADFENHIGIGRIQEKVEAAKRMRTALEAALDQVFSVESDDSAHAVRSALDGIRILTDTDPEDEFDVRQTKGLGKTLHLNLAWQDRTATLSDLAGLAADLGAIRDELDALVEAIKTVKDLASVSLGKMLDATEFWSSVETGGSRNGRVTRMWEELVGAGNEQELSKVLGGKAWFLEQARRKGQFVEGPESVTTLVTYLLTGAGTDFKPQIGAAKDVRERFVTLSQTLKTRGARKVDEVGACLQQALDPYIAGLQQGDVAASQAGWPAKDQRLTLSRSAYNLVLEAARLSDRLVCVVHWLRDSQRHASSWRQLLEDLYRKIERTDPGPQQDRLKQELRDLAPDFPDYLVPGYEPKSPPIGRRS